MNNIIGYNVYYAPDGCAEEFVGFAASIEEARTMTGRGLEESLYGTAQAAGMSAPDKSHEADEPAEWFGAEGWHCAVPVMGYYTVSRIWDDGGEWPNQPDDEFDTIEEARNAAREYIDDHVDDGEYGQADGETSVTIHFAIANEDDDEIDSLLYEADLAVNEDALIAAAGGDPDCDHEWTSEGEGGCDENPGVWSIGGTSYLSREHCAHCGVIRETTSHGPQRNPGESDTVRYYTDD